MNETVLIKIKPSCRKDLLVKRVHLCRGHYVVEELVLTSKKTSKHTNISYSIQGHNRNHNSDVCRVITIVS